MHFCYQVREVDDEDEVDPATGKPVKHKFDYTTKLVAPPRVLCVQLSRFSFDYSRGVPVKHNHRVEFPMAMDLREYCEAGSEAAQQGCHYALRGALVHLGASANQVNTPL